MSSTVRAALAAFYVSVGAIGCGAVAEPDGGQRPACDGRHALDGDWHSAEGEVTALPFIARTGSTWWIELPVQAGDVLREVEITLDPEDVDHLPPVLPLFTVVRVAPNETRLALYGAEDEEDGYWPEHVLVGNMFDTKAEGGYRYELLFRAADDGEAEQHVAVSDAALILTCEG